jgi:hypothetical protein
MVQPGSAALYVKPLYRTDIRRLDRIVCGTRFLGSLGGGGTGARVRIQEREDAETLRGIIMMVAAIIEPKIYSTA